jgi:acylphosphatase
MTKGDNGCVNGRSAEYLIPCDDNVFRVVYNRTDGPVEVSVRGTRELRVRKVLECGLFVNDNLIGTARSICRPPDKFNENKAKVMTLGRILSAARFSMTKANKKDVMTAIRDWKAYARRARKPRAPQTPAM